MSTERAAVIAGLGSYLPPRVVTNDELARTLDSSDSWIRSRTGIAQRHVASPGMATSDLAAAAGEKALKCADISIPEVIILATTTPDRPCPATAPTVAAKLGLTGIPAYDVAAVCSGFIYALATATGLITAGIAGNALVIGAETYSTIVDPTNRANAVIFGDGAGAIMLRSGQPGELGVVGPFDLGSDGTGRDLITIRAGGSEQRLATSEPEPRDCYFDMAGQQIFRLAVDHMEASARAVLSRAGLGVEQVDRLVAHQANSRIVRQVAEALGLPADRNVGNIEHVGNTAAASIPLALDYGYANHLLQPGYRVLLTAFGGGLCWGSALLSWPDLTHAGRRT